jgi:SH3-like domain-containing protein
MRYLIFFIALSFCLSAVLFRATGNAFADQTGAEAITSCDVAAYVIDHDPNGMNVRSGPGKTYKIVGNLPNEQVDGIAVHITGFQGDWARINKAVEEGGDQERTFFEGDGWVYAPLLGVGGMQTKLFEQQSAKSRVVIVIPAGDDSIIVRGCRGKWMYVEHKKMKGWAAPGTLCANSLTTCS